MKLVVLYDAETDDRPPPWGIYGLDWLATPCWDTSDSICVDTQPAKNRIECSIEDFVEGRYRPLSEAMEEFRTALFGEGQ